MPASKSERMRVCTSKPSYRKKLRRPLIVLQGNARAGLRIADADDVQRDALIGQRLCRRLRRAAMILAIRDQHQIGVAGLEPAEAATV